MRKPTKTCIISNLKYCMCKWVKSVSSVWSSIWKVFSLLTPAQTARIGFYAKHYNGPSKFCSSQFSALTQSPPPSSLLLMMLVLRRLCISIELIYAIEWHEQQIIATGYRHKQWKYFILSFAVIYLREQRITIASNNSTNKSASGMPAEWENVFFVAAPHTHKIASRNDCFGPNAHRISEEKRVRIPFSDKKNPPIINGNFMFHAFMFYGYYARGWPCLPTSNTTKVSEYQFLRHNQNSRRDNRTIATAINLSIYQ